jgi:hypothetical protein
MFSYLVSLLLIIGGWELGKYIFDRIKNYRWSCPMCSSCTFRSNNKELVNRLGTSHMKDYHHIVEEENNIDTLKWGEDPKRDCFEIRKLESWGIYPPGYHDSHCSLCFENEEKKE